MDFTCARKSQSEVVAVLRDTGKEPSARLARYNGDLIAVSYALNSPAEIQFQDFLQLPLPSDPSKHVIDKRYAKLTPQDGADLHTAYLVASPEMLSLMIGGGIVTSYEARKLEENVIVPGKGGLQR